LRRSLVGQEKKNNVASVNLDKDDISWVKAHAAAVVEAFEGEFNAARDRFNQGQLLLDRFNEAIETVLKNGKGHFSAVDEAHNEICIASALLAKRIKLPTGGISSRKRRKRVESRTMCTFLFPKNGSVGKSGMRGLQRGPGCWSTRWN
jgi:hypothetical protein